MQNIFYFKIWIGGNIISLILNMGKWGRKTSLLSNLEILGGMQNHLDFKFGNTGRGLQNLPDLKFACWEGRSASKTAL